MIVLVGFIVPYTAKHAVNLLRASGQLIFIVGEIAVFMPPFFV